MERMSIFGCAGVVVGPVNIAMKLIAKKKDHALAWP
jgi:hypothetical protein